MHRHELTDSQWVRIKSLIHRHGRSSKLGDRSFVNAVIFALRTGTPWRDLPERYGNWKTVYNRFAAWSKAGRFERMFKALRIRIDRTGSLVDATIARAHQDAAGGKGGPRLMIWVAHVVDSRRRSMPSSTPEDVHFTSS
jgi:transposase